MDYRECALSPPYRLDTVVTARCVTGCWFLAAWGVAVFQAAFLAQTWNQYQRALPVACEASAWILGAVVGLRVSYALRRAAFPGAPLLWGAAFVCCALGWGFLIVPWLSLHPSRGWGLLPVPVLVPATLALMLGVTSTCWLRHRRPWLRVGEFAQLSRGLMCLTLGLFIAWTFPAWAMLLGLVFLLPLLGLDLYPAARSPFSMRGGMVDALAQRSGGNPCAWLPLRLELRASWWWLAYLRRRRYLPPTLLSTCLEVGTGAIWYAVPTPFAAHLVGTHQVWTLAWLVAGQLAALALGASLFGKSRGSIGAPDRLIPREREPRCWRLALFALFLMAASLALLGLPCFQAPWWLALSLALYTLVGGVWNILFARLRPPISTQASSLRHLRVFVVDISSGQLAYERTLEERVTLILATWEGVLTALAAPLAGLLIDQTSVDSALVLIGLALFLLFAMILFALRFQRVPQVPGNAAGRAPA